MRKDTKTWPASEGRELGSPQQTKVLFALDPNRWHGHASESLWAEPLGEGRFRLLNAPFFVKGVSYGDVVRPFPNAHGESEFRDVDSRSGYSTCRIVRRPVHKAAAGFDASIAEIDGLGCDQERGDIGDTKVLALSIPPETDINLVYDVLDRGEKDGIWDWKTGFYGHPPNPD